MSYDPNQPQQPDSGQQPPYGQPQQPYGQPGQPQQPPYEQQWGQQPPQGYPPTQYVAPAYGAQPAPGYMPPQQPRRSRRGLWIVLAIIGGLLVLVCGGCGILFASGVGIFGGIVGSIAGPAYTVNQYYNAIEKQDYAKAYSYIGTNLTTTNGKTLTQDLYTVAAQALDLAKGKVSSFSVGDITSSNNVTTVTVSVTRANTASYDVKLQLQQVNGSWKITSYDNI